LGYIPIGQAMASHEAGHGMISIPYLTAAGPVGIRFKNIPGNPGPKACNVEGWKNRPYNPHAVLSPVGGTLLLCEGEPDTWVGHQLGLPSVGLMSSDVSPRYQPMFRYRRIVAVCHNDEKGSVKVGKGFGSRAAEIYGATAILMPEGHDLNSFYLSYGEDETLRYLGI
jgi:hypothetical protein